VVEGAVPRITMTLTSEKVRRTRRAVGKGPENGKD
jgi:hypothetical protein